MANPAVDCAGRLPQLKGCTYSCAIVVILSTLLPVKLATARWGRLCWGMQWRNGTTKVQAVAVSRA